MLGSLSTAGGAECTLEIQESQSKLFEFLPNLSQPAECGEACLPGVPGLVPIGGMVGLEVQCASQGGHCCQWQAHSHPMGEPILVLVYHPGLNEILLKPGHLRSWSWYVGVAADVLWEVIVGRVMQGEA